MTVVKSNKAIIPTYVMLEGSEYTDVDIDSIADKNGSFQCICLTEHGHYIYRGMKDIIHSFTKAENMTKLEGLSDCGLNGENEGYIDWGSENKMPYDQVREVMKFFRDVFAAHRTEAMSMWYFNPKTKDWKYIIPCQFGLAGGAVKYSLSDEGEHRHVKMAKAYIEHGTERDYQAIMNEVKAQEAKLFKEGYKQFGTIHSHCDFGAYHSGTDDADEYGFDGLHVTVGHVNSKQSFAQRIIGNTLALTLQSIEEAVDMGGHTVDEFREIDDLPDMLDKWGHRFWIERVAMPAPPQQIYTPQGGWRNNRHRFDPHCELPFAHYQDDENYYLFDEGWRQKETSWDRESFDIGDIVVMIHETIPYPGVVVDIHNLSAEEMCASTYKDDVTEFYWVETMEHQYPVLIDAGYLTSADIEQIKKFPKELIDLAIEYREELESEDFNETVE